MRIKINNKTYINFSSINISRSLDSIASTFSFEAYFDINNKEQAAALLPLGYQDVVIEDDNGKVLLTGICLNTAKNDSSVEGLVTVSGYSKSGVLNDVNVPININSLQSNGMSLKQITEKLIEPYGIKLVIDENSLAKANEKIKRTYTYMSETLDKYIINMALNKNIIVSHNEFGDLVFLSIDSNVKAKHKLNPDDTIEMGIKIDGQNMHSEISATKQTKRRNRKNPAPEIKNATVKNPLIKVHRPKNKRTNMNFDSNLEETAKSFYMEELENISLSVSLKNYYEDLVCGDFVEVINPKVFIFKPQRLLVKTIDTTTTEEEQTMNLVCVIPEAYTGEIPKDIFEL